MESDVERIRRLQREEEERIKKQRKESNQRSESQTIFKTKHYNQEINNNSNKIYGIQGFTKKKDKPKEFVEDELVRLSNECRKQKVELKKIREKASSNITDESDGDLFYQLFGHLFSPQLIIGIIGIIIVILVGYVVLNDVKETFEEQNIDIGDNVTSYEEFESIDKIFDSIPYGFITILFLILIFIVMFNILFNTGRRRRDSRLR